MLNKIEVQLAGRDVQSGDYAISTGLAEGDHVIRHPRGALVDGANVSMEKVASAASATPKKEG